MNKSVFFVSLLSFACSFSAIGSDFPISVQPVSGDRVLIQDREFVLLSVDDYGTMTNQISFLMQIAKRNWTSQHKTEHGRVAWHGKKIRSEVDDGKGVIRTYYEDGYIYTQYKPIANANKPRKMPLGAPVRRGRKSIPLNIPKRLQEALEREIKTVNIEIKAEGSK